MKVGDEVYIGAAGRIRGIRQKLDGSIEYELTWDVVGKHMGEGFFDGTVIQKAVLVEVTP